MNYKLYFHPTALKEWRKLSSSIRTQLKKALLKRMNQPHIPSAALSGQLAGCYKIKLKSAGYRLIYQVVDQKLQIIVIAVGKRDKQQAYHTADQRIASKSTDTLPSE